MRRFLCSLGLGLAIAGASVLNASAQSLAVNGQPTATQTQSVDRRHPEDAPTGQAPVRLHVKGIHVLALSIIDVQRPLVEAQRNTVWPGDSIVDQQDCTVGPDVVNVARHFGRRANL